MSKHEEFCIKNEEFCIENEELCIKVIDLQCARLKSSDGLLPEELKGAIFDRFSIILRLTDY